MWELNYKERWARRIDSFELWCWRQFLRVPWTARRSNQSILKETVLHIHWEDWCWSWNSDNLATWCKELTNLKRPWPWERVKVGGEGDDRGWDGWMASLMRWKWVWVCSGSWWWTGKPDVLHSMGSQRVGHDGVTELNWLNTVIICYSNPTTLIYKTEIFHVILLTFYNFTIFLWFAVFPFCHQIR